MQRSGIFLVRLKAACLNQTCLTQNASDHSIMRQFASPSQSILPTLQSATKRARKRRRALLRRKRAAAGEASTSEVEEEADSSSSMDDELYVYAKPARPWDVILPNPQQDPEELKNTTNPKPRKTISEHVANFKVAWVYYKSTWDSTSTLELPDKTKIDGDHETANASPQELELKLKQNLEATREGAQNLLKGAKDITGIKSKDDVRAFAAESMKLLTACLKEFMAGYRTGRDTEIDRVLHEYFQDEARKDKIPKASSKRRRKPKQKRHMTDGYA